MSTVLSLSKKMTALSIVGRKVFRIRCCGDFLEQKTIYSILPNEEVNFSRSLLVLECPVCHRQIDVEFFMGLTKHEAINRLLTKI